MLKQDNNRHISTTLLGVLIALLSSYYLYKSGYHVLFYDEIGGKDVFTFHFTRSFSEVVLEFVFWFIMFLGGTNIITGNGKGLLLGLFATSIALIPTLVYVLLSAGKVNAYSGNISINTTEREMTNLEKWNYIYEDFYFSICLTLFIIVAILIILKRRKYLETTKQNTKP